MATAIKVWSNERPKAAAKAMASTGPGKAKKASVTLMSTSSTQPPVAPATSPRLPPTATPEAITTKADSQEVRIPKSTRDSSSRPIESEPRRKPLWPGDWNGKPMGSRGL